ncbi:MAG: DUF5017 domain-containing protein, partial [Saprospiraceae bacterium]|nr:DUF5017 domain-containing protein [Saprospiraceae bacterium]
MDEKILIALWAIILSSSLKANPITIHSEDFNDCTSVSWLSVAGPGDNDTGDQWLCEFDSGNGTIFANGFGGGADEDWLISPAINMDSQGGEYFTFDYDNFFDGPFIELYYSSNFSGSYNTTAIQNATWTSLPLDLNDNYNDNCLFNGLPHRAIDLSSIVGPNVFFAFKYEATGNSGEAAEWTLDNILIQAEYYGSLTPGNICMDLKTELSLLIDDHTVIPYTSLEFDVWDSHYVTDRKSSELGDYFIVRDRNSDNPTGPEPYEYTHCVDQDPGGSSASGEGEAYNREHIFPISWWGGSSSNVQYTDIHTIIPSDKFVNQERSNFPIAEVGSPDVAFLNGGKVGASVSSGYSGSAFEPINEYKGDLARMFFYFATRYETSIGGWETASPVGDMALNGDPYSAFEDWFIDLLLTWHAQDPPSGLEHERNDAVYAIQGNRNPFIDHPEYVDLIWGGACLNPLPVDWAYVEAVNQEKNVMINWGTLAENAASHFEIEHSRDRESFSNLGYREAIGNTSLSNHYSFLHRFPQPGTHYYRIKQVDDDGQVEYSKTIEVKVEGDWSFFLFPNPAREKIHIQHALGDRPVTLVLKDALGTRIFTKSLEKFGSEMS